MRKEPLPSLIVVGSNQEGREKKAEEILGFELKGQENNPDFFYLTSATSIGIEEVRNVQRFLQLRPFQAKKKAVFINEAQFLTEEAQNALLKTLEEPAKNSLIVLSVPDDDLLLPTIVSRAEIIQLPAKPQITLSPEEISLAGRELAKLSESSVGERFSLAEEWGIYKDKETALAWLNRLTFAGRKLLLSRIGTAEAPTLLNLLRLINQTKNYLSANCNLRLTLEVFLSSLKATP